MAGYLHYLGVGFQLIGFTTVSLCLFTGLTTGTYGQIEYLQFVGGSALFYIGWAIRSGSKS